MADQKLIYIAGGADGKVQIKHTVRKIGPLDVLIKVTHSGVCGTDLHDRTAGCGLGHEGAGVIEKFGSEVTAFKVGQRVGWGWMFTTCGHCRECQSGYRQYCPHATGQKYGDPEQAGFGNYVIRHHEFVYPIPDELESKYAGPLNCAGITVYEALITAQVKPTDRVGIVGLGGLGHLAVMYARAMGCDVTVFSGSEAKRADAIALGATDFCLVSSNTEASVSKPGIDVLLFCGGGAPDLKSLLPFLACRATIVTVVIQGEPLIIPYMEFLLPGHRLIACKDATRENHIHALTFAARHNIKPWIQEYPMSVDGLNAAFAALESGSMRYKAVLSVELEGGDQLQQA